MRLPFLKKSGEGLLQDGNFQLGGTGAHGPPSRTAMCTTARVKFGGFGTGFKGGWGCSGVLPLAQLGMRV